MNSVNSPMQSSSVESPPGRKKTFDFWRLFWLTFLVVSLGYAWFSFYAPSNDIAWADNYASAKQQASDSGKPVVLYFTSTWCSPCRIMKRQVWANDEVMELVNASFVPVEIYVDDPKNAEIVTHYKVGSTPVTIVCDPQGNVVDWRSGRISKSEFLKLLDSTGRHQSPES